MYWQKDTTAVASVTTRHTFSYPPYCEITKISGDTWRWECEIDYLFAGNEVFCWACGWGNRGESQGWGYSFSIKVWVHLVFADPRAVWCIKLHNLWSDQSLDKSDFYTRLELTPPDFGILTTVMWSPYVLCISTLSFSWPTTKITFTCLFITWKRSRRIE